MGSKEMKTYSEWRDDNNLAPLDGGNPWTWTFKECCEHMAYVMATGGPNWVVDKEGVKK